MATPQPNHSSSLQLLFRAVGAFGFLCILGAFGHMLYYARVDLPELITTGIGVLLFLLLFIRAELANIKYYLHVTLYSVLIAGICVVAYLFARQYTAQVDLTKQHLFSLSNGSAAYLKRLTKEVKIAAVLSPGVADAPAVRDVQNLYKTATDKLKWEFIDPHKDIVKAHALNETIHEGDVFFVSGTNKKKMSIQEIVGQNSESAITNAIIEVTRDKKPKLYFLTGHNEIAYEQPLGGGRQQNESPEPTLAGFRKFLTDRGMDTAKLDLVKAGRVPADATALVIAGPVDDLLTPEEAGIDDYLKGGGKAMILLDVPLRNMAPQPNLKGLLTKYGVNVQDRVVVDMLSNQMTHQALAPIVSWFNAEQPITKPLAESRIIVGLSRPLEQGPTPANGLVATELLRSSDKSFNSDYVSVMGGRPTPPPENEWKGQTLGMAINKQAPPQIPNMPRQPKDDSAGGTRLVVFGTASLIRDDLLGNQNSAVVLMLNSVNWLMQQEDTIDVAPHQLEGTPIVLDDNQQRLLLFTSIILLPAAMFFGGVSYSLMRRKR